MNHSLYITTQRLELLPCSLEVAQAVVTRNKPEVERLWGVRVPDDWYGSEVLDNGALVKDKWLMTND
ncbi:MAG: hypothetical protein V7L20_29405 [Nostoc sp.]|uniref:hypothetical protein n=1 Tax=Nostoc sp. TaxID=1180 RepID=UPI002FF4471F